MIAPTHCTREPSMIAQRLPKRSLMIGTRGRDKIAPREYAAAIMPFSEP